MKQKTLAANAIFSFLNSLLSILFPLITFPYVSRILQVQNIGAVNYGSSIISYFTLLAAFGINAFAIRNGSIIRDDKKKLNHFVNQMFTINLITACGSFVLCLILIFSVDKLSGYRAILLIQSVSLISGAFAMEWFYVIRENFSYITYRNFAVKILSLILMFVFVRTDGDVLKYVAVLTFSNVAANIYNFVYANKLCHLRLVRNTDWKLHSKSLLIFFLNSVSSTIYLNFDTTMLGAICGNTSVGLYAVATKIYMIVKQVINAAVSVLIPRLSFYFANDREKFISLINRVIRIVIFLTVPMIAELVLFSRDIILFISGREYLEATGALNILSFAIVFGILANVLANGVLVGAKKEKLVIRCTIISAVVNFALNLFAIPLWEQTGAAITTLISEIVMCVMALGFAKEYITGRDKIGKTAIHITAALVAMLFVEIALNTWMSGAHFIIRDGVSCVLGLAAYVTVHILLRDEICLMFREMLIRKIRK